MKKAAASLKELYAFAIGLLARREYAARELLRKLQLKTDNAEWIETVITALQEKNYLDDARFVESYSRMRMNKGYGRLRIINELKEKGLREEVITANFSKDPEKDRLKKIREKKFGKALPTTMQEKAKQVRYLQYKGFSFDEINMVLKNDEE
jgi:regulatory protein